MKGAAYGRDQPHWRTNYNPGSPVALRLRSPAGCLARRNSRVRARRAAPAAWRWLSPVAACALDDAKGGHSHRQPCSEPFGSGRNETFFASAHAQRRRVVQPRHLLDEPDGRKHWNITIWPHLSHHVSRLPAALNPSLRRDTSEPDSDEPVTYNFRGDVANNPAHGGNA